MKVFFCTGCDAGLVFGLRRCPHCGARPGSRQLLPKVVPAWRARLAGIGAFFASQAGLSLATLLVFLGLGIALAPAGWSYAYMQTHSQVAAASAPCQGLLVFFSDMATVGEVSALVGNLGAAVVAGPNQVGAFELAVRQDAIDSVAESLGKAENTVEGVFVKSGCGPL